MKNVKIIIASVFFLASAIVGYLLFDSVKVKVDEIEDIELEEKAVKAKLIEIRKAQVAYNSLFGKYCNDWDSLAFFVKDSSFVVTDRKERQIQTSYNVNGQTITLDSTIFSIDTVAIVPVKDSLYDDHFEINTIGQKPGYDVEFKLSTKYQKSNAVAFLEIEDPNPINPERQKHGKLSPLKIGSLERSTVKGNWEKK